MPRRGSKGSRQFAKEMIAAPVEKIGAVCECASCREAVKMAQEILTSGKFGCITHAAAVSSAMWQITAGILLNERGVTPYEVHEIGNKINAGLSMYGVDTERVAREIEQPRKIKKPVTGQIV